MVVVVPDQSVFRRVELARYGAERPMLDQSGIDLVPLVVTANGAGSRHRSMAYCAERDSQGRARRFLAVSGAPGGEIAL